MALPSEPMTASGCCDEQGDVVVTAVEEHHLQFVAVPLAQSQCQLERVELLVGRELSERRGDAVSVRGAADDEAVPQPRDPAEPPGLHVVEGAAALLGNGQPLDHRLGAAGLHPRWEVLRQRGRRRVVRVDVEEDVDPVVAGGVEHREQLGPVPPALGPVDGEVAELHRDPGLSSDVDRLGHGGSFVGGDCSRVRRVQGAVRRQHPRQRGHLVEVAVGARHVGEPGAHAERALLEHAFEVALHAGQLGGSRRPLVDAHRGDTQRAVAGQRGHVDGQPALVQGIGVAVEVRPPRRQRCGGARQVVGVEVEALGLDRERRERAVADDLGGHPLAQLALAGAVGHQGEVGVGVDVDEAGADHAPGGVDVADRGDVGAERPDGGDPAAGDGDVTGPSGASGAVDDAGIADDQVEHRAPTTAQDGPAERTVSAVDVFDPESPTGDQAVTGRCRR